MTIKQPIPYYGGDRRKMLRETARVFLETGSLSETARRLGLHHSTVINRLRRAREEGCFPNPSKKAMGNISIPDPPEWREPYRTIDITEGEKYGVISDIHVPYYDRIALESALRALVQEEVDGLIISGDYWDCASISWWERTPKE